MKRRSRIENIMLGMIYSIGVSLMLVPLHYWYTHSRMTFMEVLVEWWPIYLVFLPLITIVILMENWDSIRRLFFIVLVCAMSSSCTVLAPSNTCGPTGCPEPPNTMADTLPKATPLELTIAGTVVFGLSYLLIKSIATNNPSTR